MELKFYNILNWQVVNDECQSHNFAVEDKQWNVGHQ